MAVIGVGHAGYSVARSLAFEHRFVAAVADPGVVDVSTVWLDALPDPARHALLAGDRTAFDREIRLERLFEPETNEILRRRGRWYGLDGRMPFDLYERVRAFRLGDEAARITTPMIVCDDEDERFWPGQSGRLLDRLDGGAERLGCAGGTPSTWR